MTCSPNVAVALSCLTQVLDDPAVDIAHTLDQLAKTVRLAVPTSVGLSVSSGTSRARLELTVVRDDATAAAISASLMISLPSAGTPPARTSFVFYATAKGAFVDLAADVAWLGGARVTDLVLDAHLVPPVNADPQATLAAMSAVNQAIGMLLSHGYTPEHAERYIDQRAGLTDITTKAAADLIIAELIRNRPNHPPR